MPEYRLRVAGLVIGIRTDVPVTINEYFQPFLCKEKADYTAEFHPVSRLPKTSGEVLYRDICIEVLEHYLCRFCDTGRTNKIYGVARYDWPDHRITLDYLPEGVDCVNHFRGAFFHVGWETLLEREGRLLFHSCCVNTEYGGILFSGPSGIGKSTQGELWLREENAQPVNGDRPVLYKGGDGWRAYGSPYAGSSGWYYNVSTPVRVIVMLQQAPACSIRKLDFGEAFRKVYQQMAVNSWDETAAAAVLDGALALVSEVPVYELSCTPDEKAVALLKETLKGEEAPDA